MADKSKIKRKNVRYVPESDTIAWVDFGKDVEKAFKPQAAALVFSESHSGVGLLLLPKAAAKLKLGTLVRLRVGPLDPLVAEVRWMKALGEDAIQVGFQFLE